MMSYGEIAKVLGFSSEYIRRIERDALRKLARIPELKELLLEYMDLQDKATMWEEVELLGPTHGNDLGRRRLYVKKGRKEEPRIIEGP